MRHDRAFIKQLRTCFRSFALLYLLGILIATSIPWQITTAQQSLCDSTDIDANDNNLIEICYLEDLDAIRNNATGQGSQAQGCLSECRGYELVNDLDFTVGHHYRDGNSDFSNWQPIEFYNGVLNAKGHTIFNLLIDRPETDDVGLFADLGSKAKINGLTLQSINIVGNDRVGGLAGGNSGEISYSSVVNVNTTYKIRGNQYVGGLVGENDGTVINSHTVIEVQGYERVGGLVAINFGDGTIRNSRTTSTVIGSNEIGGLVGNNDATIISGYAVVSLRGVKGEYGDSVDVGGLVGLNDDSGIINDSRARGVVSGFLYVGGLVGHSFGTIINSSAQVAVSGETVAAGGLVGRNRGGTVLNSYATGDVTGKANSLGGLVANNSLGTIHNSYATGSVIGESGDLGGLVGANLTAHISHSYAIGDVITHAGNIGSLVGANNEGSITRSYARDSYPLIGSDNNGENNDSFIVSLQDLLSPIAPGTTATQVYYQWSERDWYFGSRQQYPLLRYAEGPDSTIPACGESPQLPNCGGLLRAQNSDMVQLFFYAQIKALLEGFLIKKGPTK